MYCKQSDDKNIVEKTLRERQSKKKREKDFNHELESLETHLEKISKSQFMA